MIPRRFRITLIPLQQPNRSTSITFSATPPFQPVKQGSTGGRGRTKGLRGSGKTSTSRLSRNGIERVTAGPSTSISSHKLPATSLELQDPQSGSNDAGSSRHTHSIYSGKGRSKAVSKKVELEEAESSLTANSETHRPGQPILSSPAQSALHAKFTPSHLPLPIPLGTSIYSPNFSLLESSPNQSHFEESDLGPFGSTTSLNNDEDFSISSNDLTASNGSSSDIGSSVLSDHLNILSILGRPEQSHHLAKSEPLEGLDFDNVSLSDVSRALGEAGTRNHLTQESEWTQILKHLGDKSVKPTQSESGISTINETNELHAEAESKSKDVQDLKTISKAQGDEVDNAVKKMLSALNRLDSDKPNRGRMVPIVGPDGEEEFVHMDSVQRKRRKKIRKHKYKKRRKAQRTMRRRQGKE